jgi:hypothetical protein
VVPITASCRSIVIAVFVASAVVDNGNGCQGFGANAVSL